MARLITALDARAVREAFERVREAAGPAVEVLVAVKYLPADLLPVLAEAGVTLVGENRAQELEVKQAAHGELFTWDYIGALQSRKVPGLLGRVRLIHSVASDSALRQLARHELQGTRFLVEVNVAGEEGKAGVTPGELPAFLERCPAAPAGLMTMPPHATDPEASRSSFAALRELAAAHGLTELSMGTTQDWEVAVEEGATIIRLGTGILTVRAS